jgi:mRNA interferase RelE/StbE
VGEPLTGRQYKGQWRYRVGDYRLVVRLKDEVLLVTVIKVGHRSAVYR